MRPGRPLEPHVPSRDGHCSKHGFVKLRGHRRGVTNEGTVLIRWRCLKCHNEAEKERRRQ